jgi:hypothetical protein
VGYWSTLFFSEVSGVTKRVATNYERSVVSRMADVLVPGYQSFWTNNRSTLISEYHRIIRQFPEADAQLKQLFKVLGHNEDICRVHSSFGG